MNYSRNQSGSFQGFGWRCLAPDLIGFGKSDKWTYGVIILNSCHSLQEGNGEEITEYIVR